MLHFVKRTRAVKAALAAVPVQHAIPVLYVLRRQPTQLPVMLKVLNDPCLGSGYYYPPPMSRFASDSAKRDHFLREAITGRRSLPYPPPLEGLS